MSHPTWVRGLKHTFNNVEIIKSEVAPYVGAWIETRLQGRLLRATACVAPYVGAWIETDYLKGKNEVELVAPYVGAWIETILM